jgi:carbamoyl-phosphate synthase large subunit
VKEAVFPFARFPGVDTVLGREMRSTGEVMGLDWIRDGEGPLPAFARAFAKSQLAGGVVLPQQGTVFVSVKDADKPFILEPVRKLEELGFSIIATGGTCDFLEAEGVTVERVAKVYENVRPNIVDRMKNGEVQLVFNTTEGRQSLADSFSIRRTALMGKIPYYTTAAAALAAAQAIGALKDGTLEVRPLQSYG